MASTNSVFSQEESDTTVVVKDKKKKKERNVKHLIVLDARRSFVLDSTTKFSGLKIGVTIKEKHRLGFGFYWMPKSLSLPGLKIDKLKYPDASDTLKFKFNYTSIFYQPVLFANKRWDISTPVQLGVGRIRLFYRDTSNTRDVQFLEAGVPIFTLSTVVQFKIFRWIGIGSGLGYRAALTSDDEVKNAINAPFYNFQLKIFIGELFRMTFKRKELEEW